jgi:hypothetical protein
VSESKVALSSTSSAGEESLASLFSLLQIFPAPIDGQTASRSLPVASEGPGRRLFLDVDGGDDDVQRPSASTLPSVVDQAGVDSVAQRVNAAAMTMYAESRFFAFKVSPDCLYIQGSGSSGIYIALHLKLGSTPIFPIVHPHISLCHGLSVGDSWESLWRLKLELVSLLPARSITMSVVRDGDVLVLTDNCEMATVCRVMQEVVGRYSLPAPASQDKQFCLVGSLHCTWHTVGHATVR